MWKNLTSPEQGYSPPAILDVMGQRQLVLLRPDAVTALEPETGKEIWSVPYESTNGLVVMTPVVWNDYMFVGGYANKNMLLKLAADGKSAEMVWKDNPEHALSPVNVQPTLDGDDLYGFDQNGRLYGVRAARRRPALGHDRAGRRAPANNGTAFIVRQGDRYLAVHRERRPDRRQPHARGLQGTRAEPTSSNRPATPSAAPSSGARPPSPTSGCTSATTRNASRWIWPSEK